MSTQRACEIQAVLEGVPLPARRSMMIEYARAADPSIVTELEALPDREFDRLDLVGELLTQPHVSRPTRPASG